MPTFKNIRVKKKGGGFRTQRVQVLKSGKYKFVKNTGTAKTKTKSKSSRPSKGKGGSRTAKRGRGKIHVAPLVGLYLTVKRIYDYEKVLATRTDLTPDQKDNARMYHYIGYDPATGAKNYGNLAKTVGPVVGGKLVHRYIGSHDKNGQGLDLNRDLRAVPFIDI